MMSNGGRCYLAGPMTGKPDFNRAAFLKAAERLRGWGYDVLSPVETDVLVYGSWEEAIKHPWKEHLARDISIVPTCDTIALMPGWEDSSGANLELNIARVFGLTVISAEDGDVIHETVLWGTVRATVMAPPTEEATYFSRGVNGLPESHFVAIEDSSAFPAIDGFTNLEAQPFPMYEDNPERHVYTTGAIKDNVGKSRLDLIPSIPLRLVGDVLAYGARKYKPNNWRYGLPWGDTYASLQRHLIAWQDGEQLDRETGISHLGHALCQLMFLAEYEATGTGTDDRWRPPAEGDLKAS